MVAYREAGLQHGAPGALTDPLDSENGRRQLFAGWEHVNKLPYADATALVDHPISCLDCHDPESMRLRITRPAFMEAIAVLAASDEPVSHLPSVERWRAGDRAAPYDANQLASRQEMRSLSCAQCHVEYYFKGAEKRLAFPWHNGLRVEQMESYYDTVGWSDWTHADSGAKVLKAQLDRAEIVVVELIEAIRDARAAGASDEQLAPARQFQRKAQWRADFVNAENSMGFHAPAETLRILGEAIDYARQGVAEVARLRLDGRT